MRTWLSRVAGLFRGRGRDAELQQEMETHLTLIADELQRRGLTREEADAEARRKFGGLQRTRIAYREQLGARFVGAMIGYSIDMATRRRDPDRMPEYPGCPECE